MAACSLCTPRSDVAECIVPGRPRGAVVIDFAVDQSLAALHYVVELNFQQLAVLLTTLCAVHLSAGPLVPLPASTHAFLHDTS